MEYTFQLLENQADQRASFELMRVLRPHLSDPLAYVAQLARQTQQSYRLLAVYSGAGMVGLAGYRELENLMYGRFIYLDDLVISPKLQGSGVGRALLSAVRDEAVRCGCDHFVLDTGLHMALAQRFYFRQGLLARGMHFTEKLSEAYP